MQQLIAWLAANKTWVFSGIGIAVLTPAIWPLRRLFKRRNPKGSASSQSGGAQSINLQRIERSTVTVQSGISVADARQIATDVVKVELSALHAEAHDTFERRTNEFANLLVQRLTEAGVERLSAFKEPDMQLTVRQAQMQYGKTGDDQLRDNLLSIIEKIASEEERDLLRLVLQESIEILPKLTNEQINSLALIFIMKNTRRSRVSNHNELYRYLTRISQSLTGSLARSQASFQHLVFAGCASVQSIGTTLEKLLSKNYPGLFAAGFLPTNKSYVQLPEDFAHAVTIPCKHDPKKIQIGIIHQGGLKEYATKFGLTDEQFKIANKILHMTLSDKEIRATIVQEAPAFEAIFEFWDETPAKQTALTSVGIAIACGRAEKALGEKLNLSIWIN